MVVREWPWLGQGRPRLKSPVDVKMYWATLVQSLPLKPISQGCCEDIMVKGKTMHVTLSSLGKKMGLKLTKVYMSLQVTFWKSMP